MVRTRKPHCNSRQVCVTGEIEKAADYQSWLFPSIFFRRIIIFAFLQKFVRHFVKSLSIIERYSLGFVLPLSDTLSRRKRELQSALVTSPAPAPAVLMLKVQAHALSASQSGAFVWRTNEAQGNSYEDW